MSHPLMLACILIVAMIVAGGLRSCLLEPESDGTMPMLHSGVAR